MNPPFYLVDAFADGPFTGNPAGVVLLAAEADAGWMASFAAEINQAETAFVVRGAPTFGLRWFTPTVEVDLCGHATLAAAHALYVEGWASRTEPIRFSTKSGILSARAREESLELDFPAERAWATESPPGFDALDLDPVWVGRNRFDWLVEVSSASLVRSFVPNMTSIARLGLRGLILTARETENDFDFVSRFFAPQSGVPEDAVTGSAHCCLGPYWSERLGQDALIGYQASARGGAVGVEIRGERVGLLGRAHTVVHGSLGP